MKASLFILCFYLTGCSGIVFNSNMGPYVQNKAENSIRAGVVKEYSEGEIWQLNAAVVGYVDADYCQVDRMDEKPSQGYLMTKLKIDTQRLGGNGVVFQACGLQTTRASWLCVYGLQRHCLHGNKLALQLGMKLVWRQHK